MSSTAAVDERTARARILQAALRRFGEDGYRGTTVRTVAADAAVSPALVIHHFGSKEGLRDACDAEAVALVAAKSEGRLAAAALTATINRYGAYVARMLVEEPERSGALFDELVALACKVVSEGGRAGTLRVADDLEAQAAALLVIGLGPFVFAGPLTRWQGKDRAGAIARVAGPIGSILAEGLYRSGAQGEAS